MTLNAIDLSNYSGVLSAAQVQGLKDAGIVLALVQAVDPPPGYPAGVTRQQIQACLDGGLVVDAYVWLWMDLDVADIHRKIALLEGLNVRRVWLDVEDQAAAKYDQATSEQKVATALAACDSQPVTGADRTGIYSGRWFWADSRYMGNTTTFSDRDLWDALYDNVPDAAQGFVPYGGWSRVAIKQFHGTTTLAGAPNVDLDALSTEELAKLTGGAPPVPDCDYGWQDKKPIVVQAAGELVAVSDQLLAEANRKGGPRAREIRRLAQAEVRPRAEKILA